MMRTKGDFVAVTLLVAVDSSCNRSSTDVQAESELRLEAGVIAVSEEGGQEKRRQRSRRVKSLSARWLAMRRVGTRVRRSKTYRTDRTRIYVRFTRLSTLNRDRIAS